MLEVVRTTANVKVFKQRISHAGCDNSLGTPKLWSGSSLFLGKYRVGTREFAIHVLTHIL